MAMSLPQLELWAQAHEQQRRHELADMALAVRTAVWAEKSDFKSWIEKQQ